MKRLALWPLLIVLLLGTACLSDKMTSALGSYSDVWLISERGLQSNWVRRFADALSNPLEYVFETENEFNVYIRAADDLNECMNKKNLVLLVRTDQDGKLKNRVMKILGSEIIPRTEQAGHLILYKKNLFANDQDVYFLLVSGSVEEEYVLTRLAPVMCDRMRTSTKERYRNFLLSTRENKGGGKYLWQQYGFTVRHTSEYLKLQERPDLGAIELHRKEPSRVIGLFWQNKCEQVPQLADSTALFDFRAAIVDTLYGGDYMLKEECVYTATEFAGLHAIRLKGVWQNDADMTGGAFITYFMRDKKRKRLIAVDLLVYAPGQEKHPLMRELEALAETFRM
ncbi:MAG: DUF4837 family protein [bacterium]|nr:DUF4837 family protein [bacterium]